ncbi:MAG: hypothetical protein IPQ13_00905 [Holophagaceae bacterium]|nr:hypothetical protein [Holophagaceae bacterium]
MTTLSALQDLFQRHREGATGQWRLGTDPQRNIFFDQGRIVFAQSTHPLDRLTHLLVEKGRLTQDQMDYAMANLQPGMSVGKNLIQLGFITQRDLLDMAKLQVERVVWGAIGTANVAPVFMAKALDATVVRLSLDTPALLLGGLLNLKDRERLLELLGPLSQVMVLDRLRLNGLELPADLARIPSLINGRRTLLELSRDAAAEPVRLGAFVLFLREMGWGHLQDQPEPSTQDLLELPLGGEDALATPATLPASPEETPSLIPPIISLSEVPEPPAGLDEQPSPTPPLFHSIQAASSPTHNLDHLSSALDRIKATWHSEDSRDSNVPVDPGFPGDDEEDDQALPPPNSGDQVPLSYTVESGQAIMPTPNIPIPVLRLPPEIEEPPSHSIAGPPAEAAPGGIKWGIILGLILLVGGGTLASYWWTRRSSNLPPHELVVPSADSKGGVKSSAPETMPTSTYGPTPPPDLAPEPPKATKTEPPASASASVPSPKTGPVTPRVSIREDPNLSRSYAQGKAHKASLPKNAWTLRLEIACMKETVQNAAKLLDGAGIPYYVLPIKMNDNKICTQIFSGSFQSREQAEARIKILPPVFVSGGNKPRPFLVAEIPEKQ